jgi:hypothetical protein
VTVVMARSFRALAVVAAQAEGSGGRSYCGVKRRNPVSTLVKEKSSDERNNGGRVPEREFLAIKLKR